MGARWGLPLDIMPARDKPAWARLKRRLGPRLVRALDLNPKRDFTEHGGVRYVIGSDGGTVPRPPGHAWIVFKRAYPSVVSFRNRVKLVGVHWFDKNLVVCELVADPGGSREIAEPLPTTN